MAKDEEYHFKDADSPKSYTTGPAKINADKEEQTRAMRRKIISMALIFLVLWGGYKLISLFLEQARKNPTPKPVLTTQPVRTRQPVVTAPTTLPATKLQAPVTQQPMDSAQKMRMDNLESQVVTLQSALNDTTAKINDLTTEIATLTDQIKKAPPPIEPTPVTIREKIPPPPKMIKPRSPPYYLQAAVMGRAWLKRRDGTNVTVIVGDKIPGFGVVLLIDPNEGIVQTSTGAIIKYR